MADSEGRPDDIVAARRAGDAGRGVRRAAWAAWRGEGVDSGDWGGEVAGNR